jgi:hypothetical protein
MTGWIRDFLNRYKARTGRYAMIYTTTNWWQVCTGNSAEFSNHPFWIACYCGAPGAMPASAATPTIWQFADRGIFPGDQNLFNGTMQRLVVLAKGAEGGPAPSASSRHPSPSPPRSSHSSPGPTRSSTSPDPTTQSPSAEPAPSLSTGPASTGGRLPTTGAAAGALFGGGLLLVAGGVLTLLVLRRRRETARFQA